MTRGKQPDKRAARRGGAWLRGVSLVGMVHLPPLPGAPGAKQAVSAIAQRAVAEARLLARSCFDAVIVENFGDAPFAAETVPPETIAAMGIVVDHVVRAVPVPVGVNVLRNDALAALAVAVAGGAAFLRVNVLSGIYATDQGLITGPAHDLLRRRSRIGPHVKIAADVHVKHAVPISQPDIALAAEETAHRGGADVLIVSGPATGSPADRDEAERVKQAVPDCPLWIGSGVTAGTAVDYLAIADAVIVGTCLKRGGRTTAPLDARRVRAFAKAARGR